MPMLEQLDLDTTDWNESLKAHLMHWWKELSIPTQFLVSEEMESAWKDEDYLSTGQKNMLKLKALFLGVLLQARVQEIDDEFFELIMFDDKTKLEFFRIRLKLLLEIWDRLTVAQQESAKTKIGELFEINETDFNGSFTALTLKRVAVLEKFSQKMRGTPDDSATLIRWLQKLFNPEVLRQARVDGLANSYVDILKVASAKAKAEIAMPDVSVVYECLGKAFEVLSKARQSTFDIGVTILFMGLTILKKDVPRKVKSSVEGAAQAQAHRNLTIFNAFSNLNERDILCQNLKLLPPKNIGVSGEIMLKLGRGSGNR